MLWLPHLNFFHREISTDVGNNKKPSRKKRNLNPRQWIHREVCEGGGGNMSCWKSLLRFCHQIPRDIQNKKKFKQAIESVKIYRSTDNVGKSDNFHQIEMFTLLGYYQLWIVILIVKNSYFLLLQKYLVLVEILSSKFEEFLMIKVKWQIHYI